jgi:hypothetical protein
LPRSVPVDADERMAHSHRLEAVRAYLLEQAGDVKRSGRADQFGRSGAGIL